MAKAVWHEYIADSAGNVLSNAQIDVYDKDGARAVLHEDRDGLTPLGNPFFSKSTGFAEFYTDPGRYRIEAQKGSSTALWENELIGTVADGAVDRAKVTSDIVTTVPTVDDLRALTGFTVGQKLTLLSYNSTGDFGGGDLEVTKVAAGEADNGGTRFVVDGYVIDRINLDGKVTPAMFGGDATGVTLADAAYDACAQWCSATSNNHVLWLPRNHTYRLSHGRNPVYSNLTIDGDYGRFLLEPAAGAGGNESSMLGGSNETDGSTYPATRISNIRVRHIILDGNKANQTNESDHLTAIRLRACDDVEYEGVLLKDWNRYGIRTIGDFGSATPADRWSPVEAADYCTNIRYKAVVGINCGFRAEKRGAAIQSPACDGIVGRGLMFFDCVSGYFGGVLNRDYDFDGIYANSLSLPTINSGNPAVSGAGLSLGFSMAQSSKDGSIKNVACMGFDSGFVLEAVFDTEASNVTTREDHRFCAHVLPSSINGTPLGCAGITLRNFDSSSSDADVQTGLSAGVANELMRDIKVLDSTFRVTGTTGAAMRDIEGLDYTDSHFEGANLGLSLVRCDDTDTGSAKCVGGVTGLQIQEGGNGRIRGGRISGGTQNINVTGAPTAPWLIEKFSCPSSTIIADGGLGNDLYTVRDYSIDDQPDSYKVTLTGTTIAAGAQISQTFAVTGANTTWRVRVTQAGGVLAPVHFHAHSVGGNITVYAYNPTGSDITFGDSALTLEISKLVNT